MKRSTDRILATHTGKLFMPDAGNAGMGPPPTPPERVEFEVNELVKKPSRSPGARRPGQQATSTVTVVPGASDS